NRIGDCFRAYWLRAADQCRHNGTKYGRAAAAHHIASMHCVALADQQLDRSPLHGLCAAIASALAERRRLACNKAHYEGHTLRNLQYRCCNLTNIPRPKAPNLRPTADATRWIGLT